ncbi:hypothetical protein RUM44_005016 [Polyplax serrata]|uniref:Uncharacterized protein n=1 Tax=Polyplax serrata TaxID=468196 RepID=A0ABR1AWR9_POLSC
MDLNSLNSNQTCQCSSSGSTASVTSSSSRSSNGIPEKQGLRTIHLRRELGIYLEGNGKSGNKLVPNVKPNSFGFSFRGGREFGTGFFVSAVEKDSEAQYKGLKASGGRWVAISPFVKECSSEIVPLRYSPRSRFLQTRQSDASGGDVELAESQLARARSIDQIDD